MSACSGCGGVVGIDCFRPSECEEASEDMERRQLAYQVETLRAQLEAVEANAARYEWLRENEPEQSNVFFENSHEELDAAIDAAMSRTKKETK